MVLCWCIVIISCVFSSRSFRTRNQNKKSKERRKRKHTTLMAFTMVLAMTWQSKVTSARRKVKKHISELMAFIMRAMAFAMDFEDTFTHFTLMAFTMRPWHGVRHGLRDQKSSNKLAQSSPTSVLFSPRLQPIFRVPSTTF